MENEAMDCAQCGTWNPDDKVRCWRCGTELPKPTEPKRSRRLSSQQWVWIVAALFSLLTILMQCGIFRGGDSGNDVGLLWMPVLVLAGVII
jgi:hypothetical protein